MVHLILALITLTYIIHVSSFIPNTSTIINLPLQKRLLPDNSRISRRSLELVPNMIQNPTRGDDDQVIDTPTTTATTSTSVIRNFRRGAGLKNIYRCASTDELANLFTTPTEATAAPQDQNNPNSDNDSDNYTNNDENKNSDCVTKCLNSPEHILLNNAGLILDLRSSSERNDSKANLWMKNLKPNNNNSKDGLSVLNYERGLQQSSLSLWDSNNDIISQKLIYRVDVLSPDRLFQYLSDNWIINPIDKARYAMNYVIDSTKLHEMRMDILNEKGLDGLYEAILETSGEELSFCLKAITLFLERQQELLKTRFRNEVGGSIMGNDGGIQDLIPSCVVVHCVQGKDRTGLVIMLCQSMLQLDDESIIADYAASNPFQKDLSSSAAAETMMASSSKKKKGKLDRQIFSGAPREVMISTLAKIRSKYGSVSPGYLDSIGFNQSWINRFVGAANISNNNTNRSKL